MRSRILISKEQETIILCNQKNGYSTLNGLLDPELYSRSITSPKQLKTYLETNDEKYKIIFIKREPYDRFCSFYSNWIIDKGEKFSFRNAMHDNVHYKNLKKVISPKEYKDFCEEGKMSQKQRLLLFLDYFYIFYNLDTHTIPQSLLYRKAGLQVEDLEIIDIKNMSSDLGNILKLEVEQRNISSNKKNDFFYDDEVLQKWQQIYVPIYFNDYKELGYKHNAKPVDEDYINLLATKFNNVIDNKKLRNERFNDLLNTIKQMTEISIIKHPIQKIKKYKKLINLYHSLTKR